MRFHSSRASTSRRRVLKNSVMAVGALALAHFIPASALGADTAAAPDGKSAAATATGVSLFNGKDLSGWEGAPGWWTVKDGALTSQSTPEKPCKACNYLVWKGGQPSDFELTCDFKLSAAANSPSTAVQRPANSIAPTGQTPPHVWQKVQSAPRVPKSLRMASNGQISTHRPQATQFGRTLRLVRRTRLATEKSAPLGQTYLHQNRRFTRPRPKMPANSPSDRNCPPFMGGT